MTDEDGHRIDAAMQFGFEQTEDDGPYSCTEAQLIAFAKAAERKGRAEAIALATQEGRVTDFGARMALKGVADELLAMNAASDAALAPILAAEEHRFMTSRGYVRGTDDPGGRWVRREESKKSIQISDYEVCEDEGCPQYGTPHVCIDRVESEPREACHYCGPGKYTGLPGGACENCMNTGYANPTVEDLT